MEDTLAVQVRHTLRDLVDHLEQVNVIERRKTLEVRHERAVLLVGADEEPWRVGRAAGTV